MKRLYIRVAVLALKYLRTRIRLSGEESDAWRRVVEVLDSL